QRMPPSPRDNTSGQQHSAAPRSGWRRWSSNSAEAGRRGKRNSAMADRFDKFSERFRHAISLAEGEALRLHDHIGTEHILLGVLRVHDGTAARALRSLGAPPSALRARVDRVVRRGDPPVEGERGLTPRAKRAIELAVDQARLMQDSVIGTGHLLLGLLREDES